MFESALSAFSGVSPVFASSGQGKRFVFVRSVLLDVGAVFSHHHLSKGHAAGGHLSASQCQGAAHTGRCAQLAWLVVLGFFFVVHGGSVLRHGLGRKPEIFLIQGDHP